MIPRTSSKHFYINAYYNKAAIKIQEFIANFINFASKFWSEFGTMTGEPGRTPNKNPCALPCFVVYFSGQAFCLIK